MRWFLDLSFCGARFHGWQVQPNAVSVQQVVEESLSTVLRHPTPIVGAGRTDAGVNARRMIAHFDTDEQIADSGKFLRSLDRLCGPDIAFRSLRRVKDDAHARFDATSRSYKYFVIDHKSPFFGRLAYLGKGLDYARMNDAAELLLEVDDFTSFAKLHSDAKTNICRVSYARWSRVADGTHVFHITADRFLRNMVRAVVGTLVEVGRGKMDLDGFRRVIESKNRCSAGNSMPAEALYLWDVTYPETIYL